MGVYEENIVPIKLSRLAEYVASKKRITLSKALIYIYTNPMYPELYNEGAKWWYLSTEALYVEFERCRKKEKDEVSKPAFEFYVYTMEMYAIEKKISGLLAFSIFREYGVDELLIKHYDLLHTQGTGYVIDEIEEFLKARGYK